MELLAQPDFLLNIFLRSLPSLDVVAAELDGSGPAVDLFAKPGERVKPMLREGKRIGWYSVGPDGVDDGVSDTKDFAIPISEKPGRMRFSDLLEPRMPPALPTPLAP